MSQVIKQVDKPKNEVVLDERNSYIFENILSNYRVERRVFPVLYQQIAESFQRYLESLDFDEMQALNLDLAANGGAIQPIENYSDCTELLQVFDLFYYINGRLPYTTGLLPIPDGNFPAFVDGQKISIKKLYEEFHGTLSHSVVTVPFLCALNLYFMGELNYSKDALTELNYNLSLQVLSDEYELSPTYDAISELIVDISANIENAIRSNQLKREEDAAKNELLEKSLYEFKPKISDFERTEKDIIQSIIDDKTFILKKTDDDYFPPQPEVAIKIEDDFKRENKDFLKTAVELNKVDIGSTIEAKNIKIDGILDTAVDLPQDNVKIYGDIKVNDILGDLFENKTMTREEEKFSNDLFTKTADAKKPQIIPKVKYIPAKIEQPKLKYEDVVIKKDLPDVKPNIKQDIFLPDAKPDIKTDISLPDTKIDIKPDVSLPDAQTEMFVDDNYQSWVDYLSDIKPDVFLHTTDDNLDAQTETFIDDNYQSWVDDLPDVKPDNKTDIVLEDISDADTIAYTSDIEFVKKVPQNPRDKK